MGELKATNKKLQLRDREVNTAKSQVKDDGEKHEKDLEAMEAKLNEVRRNLEANKRKLETAESNLNRRTQEHEDKKKTVEKLEKDITNMKRASGDSVNQVKEQKTALEQENKEATLKIIKLQDENVKLQAKLNDDVQDLNRAMKTVREELNKNLKAKSD